MKAATARFAPCGRNTSVVQIVSYENKCLAGTLRYALLDCTLQFDHLIQFLFLMEELMDREGGPQRGREPRSFQPEEGGVLQSARRGVAARPVLATFRISILFRQNASWQGSVYWAEQALESQFRSVLELVELMDNALTASLEMRA